MLWARMLAYITGIEDQELLPRNESGRREPHPESQCKGRLLLSDAKKATLAEMAQRLARKALEELAAVAKPDTLQEGSGAVSGATGRSAEVLRARGDVGVEGDSVSCVAISLYKDACSLAQAKGLASLIYH